MGGLDVAVAIEQVVGARDRTGQRAPVLRVGPAGGVHQGRNVAQVAGHGGAQVCGLREATAAVGAGRAEVGRTQQLADGAERVTAEEVGVRDLLQEGGNVFIRPGGGLGQVPGVARRVVDAPSSEDAVRLSALVDRGQLHHGRPDQRMAERDPGSRGVERHKTLTFRPVQCSRLLTVQHVEVPGRVEHGQQQRSPAGGRKCAERGRRTRTADGG